MHIRRTVFNDIDAILKIESLSIPHPYTQEQFLEELSNKNSHFFVVVNKDEVIAYLLCHLILNEIELIKIVVHPDFQRQGIGLKIFYHLLDLHPDIKKINLEVRESNQIAIQFYQKLGFDRVGKRTNYYSNREDAILMTKNVFSFP